MSCSGLKSKPSKKQAVVYFLLGLLLNSGVHPPSYPMGTGGSFPGGKAVGAPSTAVVMHGGAIPPLPNTSLRRGA
jgi:hypothetical protein